MSERRFSVGAPAIAALLFVIGCNAITGTGKYDIVDCPNGSCADGGGADALADGSVPGADAGVDAAPIDCGPGRAPLTLTVSGRSGSVSAKTGGSLSVTSGATETACLSVGGVELRTNGPSATWSGASCKDGNSGDRCELDLPAGGLTMSAVLRD